MKQLRINIIFMLLIALFAFLPFSSWLVSLSGNPWLSLTRDILVVLIAILALLNIKKLNKASLIIATIFIIYGFMTYFWKSSSSEQWLRGFRFFFFPIIFYIAISLIDFSQKQKKALLWVVLGGFIVLGTIAILEYFNVRVPLTSNIGTVGALEDFQGLSGGVARLQSILAGPNAFGIYLVALTAFFLSAFRQINRKIIYLVSIAVILTFLTYSRSALIGSSVLLVLFVYFVVAKRVNHFVAVSCVVTILVVASIIGLKMYNSEKYKYYVTHGTSTTLRTEQIQRIWRDKNEIGLFGRSMGTAGPSSQNRLDGGPNHWSENIYLDTFEETGLIGLVLYLCLIVAILVELAYNFPDPINKSAVLAIVSFILMGLFINIYTGQIGIFLVWLLVGLSQKGKLNVKNIN